MKPEDPFSRDQEEEARRRRMENQWQFCVIREEWGARNLERISLSLSLSHRVIVASVTEKNRTKTRKLQRQRETERDRDREGKGGVI